MKRVELKTKKELQQQINYCYSMFNYCQHIKKDFDLALFYRHAMLGYKMRLNKLGN